MVTGLDLLPLDLLPEELMTIQPEELKNAIILVAIIFGLLNVVMDVYRMVKRSRGARKFWIKHLTRADKNFDFAVSSFNWFDFTPIKLHFGLLVTTYLIFSIMLFVTFYFQNYLTFFAVISGAVIVATVNYYIHKGIKVAASHGFSEALIGKLRRQIRYSLILRYLNYGIILYVLYLTFLISEAISETSISQKYGIIMGVLAVTTLIPALSIILSRKSQKITIDFLRKKLNEHYVRKPEVTVYTEIESGKISGRLTDIFDNSVLTLEDEGGQKFFIPWKSIDFLAVKSADSADSAGSDAKEEVTESPD